MKSSKMSQNQQKFPNTNISSSNTTNFLKLTNIFNTYENLQKPTKISTNHEFPITYKSLNEKKFLTTNSYVEKTSNISEYQQKISKSNKNIKKN